MTKHYKKGREALEVTSPADKTLPDVTSPIEESDTSRGESEETKWPPGKSGTLLLSSEDLNKPLSSDA